MTLHGWEVHACCIGTRVSCDGLCVCVCVCVCVERKEGGGGREEGRKEEGGEGHIGGCGVFVQYICACLGFKCVCAACDGNIF